MGDREAAEALRALQRLGVERLEVRRLDPEAAQHLLDEQQAVGGDRDLGGAPLGGAPQREEEGAVLGDVVGLVAERLEVLLGGLLALGRDVDAGAGGPGLPRAAPSMKARKRKGTRSAESAEVSSRARGLVVQDPLAAVAVDDLAALLQDLHGGRPDLHVAGGAGAADDEDDGEAVLLVDQAVELGAVARRDLGLEPARSLPWR